MQNQACHFIAKINCPPNEFTVCISLETCIFPGKWACTQDLDSSKVPLEKLGYEHKKKKKLLPPYSEFG